MSITEIEENTIASAEYSGLNIAPEIEYKSPIAKGIIRAL